MYFDLGSTNKLWKFLQYVNILVSCIFLLLVLTSCMTLDFSYYSGHLVMFCSRFIVIGLIEMLHMGLLNDMKEAYLISWHN